TVFLKGCPLHCLWCHNPESMRMQPQLSFLANKCIGCGACLRICPHSAHRMDEEGRHIIDREACTLCGQCAGECYAEALELVGKEMTVEEVMDQVGRDASYYETSGGGMTLSGGEPTLQVDFSEALLKASREEGFNNCVETCGQCEWSRLERLLPLTEWFLYDWKESDPDRHREYTGVDNVLIRENLEKLNQAGADIVLRCVMIPGLNDRDDHFDTIAELQTSLERVRGVELMPYHNLGESKLTRFDLDAAGRADSKSPEKETVEGWIQALRDRGATVLNGRSEAFYSKSSS
ncbi:MAG: glycyl-radical enzyme activating protein, partial [Candidatus Sumerlaeota bacterium]